MTICPMFHTTDPHTSRDAARIFLESGLCKIHSIKVLMAVRAFPGKTPAQYAEIIFGDWRQYQKVEKRLSEWVKTPKIQRGTAVKCPYKGTMCTIYWPT